MTAPDLLKQFSSKSGPEICAARRMPVDLFTDAHRIVAAQEGPEGRGTLLLVAGERRPNAISASPFPPTNAVYVEQDFIHISGTLLEKEHFKEIDRTDDGRRTIRNVAVSCLIFA